MHICYYHNQTGTTYFHFHSLCSLCTHAFSKSIIKRKCNPKNWGRAIKYNKGSWKFFDTETHYHSYTHTRTLAHTHCSNQKFWPHIHPHNGHPFIFSPSTYNTYACVCVRASLVSFAWPSKCVKMQIISKAIAIVLLVFHFLALLLCSWLCCCVRKKDIWFDMCVLVYAGKTCPFYCLDMKIYVSLVVPVPLASVCSPFLLWLILLAGWYFCCCNDIFVAFMSYRFINLNELLSIVVVNELINEPSFWKSFSSSPPFYYWGVLKFISFVCPARQPHNGNLYAKVPFLVQLSLKYMHKSC